MSDSNDGSSGMPPESPDLDVHNSGLRERQVAPSPAGSGVEDGPQPQLPRVPEGVMTKAQVKPTAGVATSLVPSTEPSAELAARSVGTEPPPVAETEAAPVSAPPSALPSSPASEGERPESEPSVLQVLAPHFSEERLAARRKDKLQGLVIIGVTFVACILLSVWGKQQAEPEESLPPRPPTTEGLVGWPEKVDPFAVLPLARSISQRDLLRGIVAENVVDDGTIDFKKSGGPVRYSFQSEPGHGPQPPRDPGKVPPRSYCGKQSVHIRRHGIVADPDVPAFPCPTKPRDSLPDPECSAKQIWELARSKQVPTGKPARIEYFAARGGPAYRFTVPGTQHRLVVDSDCKTELKSRDTQGGVP